MKAKIVNKSHSTSRKKPKVEKKKTVVHTKSGKLAKNIQLKSEAVSTKKNPPKKATHSSPSNKSKEKMNTSHKNKRSKAVLPHKRDENKKINAIQSGFFGNLEDEENSLDIPETLESLDDDLELESGEEDEKLEPFNEDPASPAAGRLADEYNPDDEFDDASETQYGYGWGYNDSFDRPDKDEEEDEEEEELDEDHRYANGLDVNNDN